MRFARKLFLLSVMALAAMAFAASSAAADVEVSSEADELHCPCPIHATSVNTPLIAHLTSPVVTEAVVLNCEIEIDGIVNEDGSGEVTGADFHPSGSCTREPCGETESPLNPHWPLQIVEEDGSEEVQMTMCFQQLNNTQPISCPIDIPLDSSSHDLVIETPTGDESDCQGFGGAVEFQMHFIMEEDDGGVIVTHP